MIKIYSVSQLTPAVVQQSIEENLLGTYKTLISTLQWDFGVPVKTVDLHGTQLAQDLNSIFTAVIEGTGDPGRVYAGITHIIELLFKPLGVTDYNVPEWFWHTPLGFACRWFLVDRERNDRKITTAEAMNILGVSRQYISRMAEELQGEKTSSGWLFRESIVRNWEVKKKKRDKC